MTKVLVQCLHQHLKILQDLEVEASKKNNHKHLETNLSEGLSIH